MLYLWLLIILSYLMDFVEDNNILALINPVRTTVETGSYRIANIERFIKELEKESPLNLYPEFQRGLEWTLEHQTKFIENILRGLVPHETNLIRFNDPSLGLINSNYMAKDSDLPVETQCIDGLQRFNAMLCYMRGELKPFGLSKDQIESTYHGVRAQGLCFTAAWYDFQYESDLLEFYRDLNWGGIPHSDKELIRINGLIVESKKKRGIALA